MAARKRKTPVQTSPDAGVIELAYGRASTCLFGAGPLVPNAIESVDTSPTPPSPPGRSAGCPPSRALVSAAPDKSFCHAPPSSYPLGSSPTTMMQNQLNMPSNYSRIMHTLAQPQTLWSAFSWSCIDPPLTQSVKTHTILVLLSSSSAQAELLANLIQ